MAPMINLLTAIMAATAAQAKTIPIKVVDDAFEPNTAIAAVGDVLEFHFMPHNHSVVMGDFTNACQPAKTGGFYSGFVPVSAGEAQQVFRVQINDTNPVVYYCSQGRKGGGHCQIGMVGVVNPADAGALQKYVEAAKTVELAGSPPAPFGGMFAASSGNSTGGSTTTTAPTTRPTGPSGTAPTSPISTSAAGDMMTASVGSGILAVVFAMLMA